MYDGALLFTHQQPVAAAEPVDAGSSYTEPNVPDAGHPQALQVDAGKGEPGDVIDEFAGRDAQPVAAGYGGAAGAAGSAGGAAGSAGAAGAAGASGSAGSAGVAGAAAGAGGAAGYASDPRCSEPGAKVWADNEHCYIPVDLTQSWNLSRDRCVQLGARLVTITSAQEQAFVATVGTGTSRWIGLSRFGAATFSWISGETLAFTRWQAGAPSASAEAAAFMRGDTQEWTDSAISTARASLCERELD